MNNKLPNKLLPFIWHFLKKYKITFFIYLLFSIFIIDMSILLIQPYLLKVFFDKLNNNTITLSTGLFLLLGIAFSNIMFLANIFISTFDFKSIKRATEDIRCEMFKHLIKQTTNFFNINYSGELVNKINSITDSTTIVIECITKIIKNITLIIIFIVILFCFNLQLGFIGIIWSILYFISSYYFIIIKKSGQSKLIQDDNNKIVAFVNDDFSNIKNIKIFSNQIFERKKLKNLLKNKFKRIYLEVKYSRISDCLFFILDFSLICLTLIISLIKLRNNTITVGDFVFLISLIRTVIVFSKNIIFIGNDFKNIVIMNDSLKLITNDIAIKDKKKASALNIVNGKIVFKNVNFSYDKQ